MIDIQKAALIWSDELTSYDLSVVQPGHPMRGERCKMGSDAVAEIEGVDILPPRYAFKEELAFFHKMDYIEAVERGEAGDVDTPIAKALFDPARLSVGATLRAVEAVLKDGYKIAVNICGGWHHAFEDRARGFCVFNDVAIGARYAQKLGAKRIFIIDWDEHHGDGTQRAFYEDDDVFTLSIHQHPATQYPYVSGYEDENHATNLNIPIIPGRSETEIIREVIPTLSLKIRPFKPDLIIVQMGVDGHKEDPMSSIDLGDRFYEEISKVVARCAKNLGVGVVLLGGGGFNFPKTAELWKMIVKTFMEKM